MNLDLKNKLCAGKKCLLITSNNNLVELGICNYIYQNNKITIKSKNYTNVINSLNNDDNCIVYITVCDEEYVYYLIIKGTATLSSTLFQTPSICNQNEEINNYYLINIEINNIDCYKEKRY